MAENVLHENLFTDYRLHSSSLGENIHAGANVRTGEEVVIKIEPMNVTRPMLQYSTKICKSLQNRTGVPTLLWSGREGPNFITVTEMLGPSLLDLLSFCGGQFGIKTVLMLGCRFLKVLHAAHDAGIILRDFRPENFVMGRKNRRGHVYAINYQLAKRYRDKVTCQHYEQQEGCSLVGTARYASIHSHRGINQSRRDDLESLGYLLLYFLRGSLPWQGLSGSTSVQHAKILARKELNVPVLLCKAFPTVFEDYFHYVLGLQFGELPDHFHLIRLFGRCLLSCGYHDDSVFDWDILKGDHFPRDDLIND